jgi:dihydropteroate synthase
MGILMETASPTVTVSNVMIGPKHPVRIMAVLNISRESFYKESIVTSENLERTASSMVALGADIVDIGGASTAPKTIYNRTDIAQEEEKSRIIEAMNIIGSKIAVPISVDTSSSEIAEAGLNLGASLINDVTGLQGDEGMAELVARRRVPVVIMANCRQECASIDMVMKSLKKSLQIAREAGITEDKIIIDPGIGFGKPTRVDLSVLRNLRIFSYMRHPLLVGVSRKAFIGKVLDKIPPEGRLSGSLAATAIAVYNGANVLRTHDVRETLEAAKVAYAVKEENSQGEQIR